MSEKRGRIARLKRYAQSERAKAERLKAAGQDKLAEQYEISAQQYEAKIKEIEDEQD